MKLIFWRKQKPVTLSQAITQFLEHRAELVSSNEIKPATLIRSKMLCANIQKFIQEGGLEPMTLQDITPKFANDYYYWLLTNGKVGKAYAAKNIQMLKCVINYAILCGHIKFNVILPMRFKRGQKKRIVFLSPENILDLERKQFASARLQQVADLFLLQCHTGFSYSDLSGFDPEAHIETDSSGRKWIIKPRNKNENECVLPLFEGAARIIHKYTSYAIGGKKVMKLPLMSNQKYNTYLKEIADIMDFDLQLTTHVGRKTFGTVALNNGFSLEAVSKMLGHTSIKTTQDHYAVLLKQRLIAEAK